MKQQSNKVTMFSRLFLAFLASVFLFAFLILLTLRFTLFNESYMQKQAEHADYYSNLTNEINRQIEDSALGSNIPEGVLANTVSEKMVRKDVIAYYEAIYNPGIQYEISDKNEIYTSALGAIEKYMKANEIETTETSEKAVKDLANNTVEIYKGYIKLPFLISFGRKVMNYKSKIVLFLIICGVLWIGLSFILLNSLRGYVHRLLRFWEYIFVGSGLMMSVFPALILLSGQLKRIGIQSQAMYEFIQTYLASFLKLFIIIGLFTIALGIISAILSEIKRKKLFSP
ncbi:hypothetical protein ACYSNW_00370 [Enterococcus sp. LJL99]